MFLESASEKTAGFPLLWKTPIKPFPLVKDEEEEESYDCIISPFMSMLPEDIFKGENVLERGYYL